MTGNTGTTIPGDLTPTPLSGYPQASIVNPEDLIFISQGGVSKRGTVAQALAAAGAAPTDATYMLLSADSDLPSSRVLQFNATQFTPVDNGAGLTYVVALNFSSAATPLTDNATAVIGTDITPAHSDHRHPINVSATDPVRTTGNPSAGAQPFYARSDHNHGAPPPFTGASAGVNGSLGGVAQPLAGQQAYFLRGDATWAPAPGTGTVTSVALTMPSIFSVAGSPITTAGTLAVTLATEAANTIFAGPTLGADAAPTFRALVAADIPNLDAAKITTGIFPLARGGTNASDAQGARLSILPAVAGQANKALVVNAGETDFTYATVGTGTVTSIGLTGTAAEIAVSGASPITTSGSWVLSLPSALTFTGKTITGGAFTGGTWDNGIIGGSTPAAITSTTLTATAAVALSPANANVVISPTGTGLVTIAPATAGSINNVVIGGSTPLAITGTLVAGNAFVPNLSSVPTNGMYLPASNTLGFAAQSALQFQVLGTASAANYMQIAGGASGTGATLSALGAGTDLDLRLTPKGAGYVFATVGGIKFPDNTTQTTAATAGLTLAQVQAAAVSL